MSTNNAIAVTLRARAQAAFERLSSACPEDAGIVGKYLAALHGKNVIALDEGEAFVLTDSGGRQIKATKRTVRLSVENGGLVQPVFNGPYVISAPGYGMLARAAGEQEAAGGTPAPRHSRDEKFLVSEIHFTLR